MVHRREILNGLTVGSVFSTLTGPPLAAGARAQDDPNDILRRDLANGIRAIRDELVRQSSFWELAPIRDPLKTFLRTHGKFPDFIEVGIDVWQDVYDWHVRYQQPIVVASTADARYTIRLFETSLVLRTDVTSGYVGIPYDNR